MLTDLLFGTIAYLLAVFPLAYVWHLVLFKSRFEEIGYFGREEPIIMLGFLAILFQGLVISALFAFWRGPGNPFTEAFMICVPLMALIWSAQVLAHAAKFEVEIRPFILLETAYFVVQAALVSLAIGFVYTWSG